MTAADEARAEALDLDAIKVKIESAVRCAWCDNRATGHRQIDWGAQREPSCERDHGGEFEPDDDLGWVSDEDVTALVSEAERLTAQLQAAQATIAELQAWEVTQRVDHSKHVHAEDSLVACPEISWLSVEARDVAAILSRADLSTLAEHDKQVAAKALKDAADDLTARGEALFESTEKAWQESEFGKLDTDWDHPGRDALADAAASGVMKRDAGWLKARAASIEQAEAE